MLSHVSHFRSHRNFQLDMFNQLSPGQSAKPVHTAPAMFGLFQPCSASTSFGQLDSASFSPGHLAQPSSGIPSNVQAVPYSAQVMMSQFQPCSANLHLG